MYTERPMPADRLVGRPVGDRLLVIAGLSAVSVLRKVLIGSVDASTTKGGGKTTVGNAL